MGGLVGYNGEDGLITNCRAAVSVIGGSNVGGLVGHNSASLSNSYSTGSVKTNSEYSQNIGGLVGYNTHPISNSYASGDVDGVDFVGGFVGANYGGEITGSYSTGKVTANTGFSGIVGGFVGFNLGNISDSYSRSNVSTTGNGGNIGGFVGSNGGEVYTSYSTGNVTAGNTQYNIGGFAGYNIKMAGDCGFRSCPDSITNFKHVFFPSSDLF